MIKLYKNNAYKWFKFNNIYTIGYAFHNNYLYKDKEFATFIYKSKENIEEIVKEIIGYFAIVIQEEDYIILISDIIRSFPIFYNAKSDVTDDINLLKGELNELSINELLQARWVSGDETIYKDVKQIENASIVYIYNNKTIKKKKYFKYKYMYNKTYSFEELDNIFLKMTDRIIKYLDGKTAVIPLSGGGDSRLLAYYLKKSGYPSIITYTYGNEKYGEVEVSKKVAEYLNLPWFFIKYKKKQCNKLYNNKKFADIVNYLGRGYSIPHIQELAAIDQLTKENIIDKNCVILPGFTLDFLAGSHLYLDFLKNNIIESDLILEKIYSNNYNLTNNDNNIFNNKLKELLGLDKKNLDVKEGANIYEQYDFEERQAKFINNAVRVYDYYGIKWYLPFWDKSVIEFWNSVSLEDRYNKRFFMEFCNYKYKELMNYAPLWKKQERGKLNFLQKINLIWYNYYHNPLNYYYYFKFKKYLKYVILEKNFNYDYYAAKDYVKYIKKSNKK